MVVVVRFWYLEEGGEEGGVECRVGRGGCHGVGVEDGGMLAGELAGRRQRARVVVALETCRVGR